MAPGDGLLVFPHERVVFFSDAVFAIAMTLLAIEIRAPAPEEIARVGASMAWSALIPLVIAYAISFMVLALFWVGNMQAWKYVTRATPRLIWLNVAQLLFVALVPFGTSLFSHSMLTLIDQRAQLAAPLQPQRAAFIAYCAILTIIALLSVLLRRRVALQEDLVTRIGPQDTRWFLLRALIPMLVFALGMVMVFVIPPWAGGWWFMLIWPLSSIARRIVYRDAAGAVP